MADSRTINHASELDLDTLTFESFRNMYGVFRSNSYYTYHGTKRVKVPRSWDGMQTEVGIVEASIWYAVAAQLIERAGEAALFENLLEWYTVHGCYERTPEKIRQYVLKIHVGRYFDDEGWIYYIPFNRKYRPLEVAGREFPRIFCHRCKQVGAVTQEQVERRHHDEIIPCEHCAGFAKYTLLEGDTTMLERCLELISKQQGTDENAMIYVLGQQLKDIVATTPGAAELVAVDIVQSGMGLQDCMKKLDAYASAHKKGNRSVVTPKAADQIIRKFYGLMPATQQGQAAAPRVAPAVPSLADLLDD